MTVIDTPRAASVPPGNAPRADTTANAPTSARRRLALGLLVSAQFVVMLDTSIVNVALPSIQTDLGLSSTAATWVVNAYVLAFGGLLLLSGRAADVLGRRRLFRVGSALFALGSLLAAGAGGPELLVAGRVVQGVGAAALSPAAMSLLLVAFPGPHRARAMSAWGAASTLGGATGVLAGGVLSGWLGWSAVFLVTLPVSIAAVVLAPRVLDGTAGVPGGPTARRLDPRRLDLRRLDLSRLDLGGAAAVTGAVLALVHGTLEAARGGWSSPSALASLAGAAALLGAFIVVERRAADPLVPLELFRSRLLSTGIGLALLGGAARASTFLLAALYLQQAVHLAPAQAGLAMVPTSVTGFVVSLVVLPRVLRTVGPRRSLVIGLVVLAAGHLWLAHAPQGSGYVVSVLPGLLLVATGVALSFTPTTMVIASTVPEARAGLASGLAGSSTQVGAALGTATFTAIGVGAAAPAAGTLSPAGFTAAFTAAAVVALATAALGCTIARRR
jgi:EmrB/QacA subfamily drug resistance transporter